MKTLICTDRDGTLIYDDHYYLGRANNWREKVEFLDGVVSGLKLLNDIPQSRVCMVTQQSGISVKEFPLLTIERAIEVCATLIETLNDRGAVVDDFFLCPHVPPDYPETHPQYTFHEDHVHDCKCVKPNLGLVRNALEKEGLRLEDVNLYFIGDRAADVETGVNAGGLGILVPFRDRASQIANARELPEEKVHVARTFLDAAKFVAHRDRQGGSRLGRIH